MKTNRQVIFKHLFFLFTLLPAVLWAQEENEQPRFSQALTAKEFEDNKWTNKISETDTLTNYIVQLVTTMNEDDYATTWVCLQIFERESGKFVQEIDLSEYDHSGYDKISSGDFNFDGHEDFSLFANSYNMGNYSENFFLYAPDTQTFFDSGFNGTNMYFDSDSKTITSHNQCCAGTYHSFITYKLIDNKQVKIEQQCLEAERDDNGDLLSDKTGDWEFIETDCGDEFLTIRFESVGQKKNFRLYAVFFDEYMLGGSIQYKGQRERIPIHFDHEEIIENRETESRPDVRKRFYNEIYNGENTGVYCFGLQGAEIYNAYYIRKKDNKQFTLKVIDYDNEY